MSKMSQKDCVYAAVQAYLADSNREHELDSGEAIKLSKSDKATVVGMVVNARAEMIIAPEADAKYDSVQKFRTYVLGLVDNWLRKDKRLNGGIKYEAKNPGSRAGSGDTQLKALRALRSTVTDTDTLAVIDSEIQTRISEIKATKVKHVEVNVEALPEHLRHLVK